jgi:hypothetical protein
LDEVGDVTAPVAPVDGLLSHEADGMGRRELVGKVAELWVMRDKGSEFVGVESIHQELADSAEVVWLGSFSHDALHVWSGWYNASLSFPLS